MSNNSFSSLENISILIKSLINSNKDALPLKHINKLVDDLTNLLNSSDNYDMEIEVGDNDNIKIFKVQIILIIINSIITIRHIINTVTSY